MTRAQTGLVLAASCACLAVAGWAYWGAVPDRGAVPIPACRNAPSYARCAVAWRALMSAPYGPDGDLIVTLGKGKP
jgi:hypothetical protein